MSFQLVLHGKLSFIRQQNRKYVDDSQSTLANVIKSPSLEEAILELLEKGLIRKDQRNISVHRVVQEAMNYHSMEDLQASFDAAVRLVRYSFPDLPYSRRYSRNFTESSGVRSIPEGVDRGYFAQGMANMPGLH